VYESPRPSVRLAWLRRAIPAGVVAVLVVGGIAVVRTNASASPLDTYRTTTVTTGSVEQRLDLTGSVQRANQVSQSFAVNGTVSSVSVAVGDTVKVGQALATLDPRPLGSAVTAAEAALAKAKATLESDQASTTTASTPTVVVKASTQTTSSHTAPSSSSSSGRSGAGAGANQSLARAQRGLTTAQGTVAADLQRASEALTQCASFFPSSPPSGPSPTGPSPTSPAPTGTPTSSPTTAPSAGGPTTTVPTSQSDAAIKACIGALRTAPSQQQIQRDQKALTRSRAELTTAVTLAITTAGNTPNASGTAKPSGTTSHPATTQPATNQSEGRTVGTGESSAARLTSDQGAVTSAAAALSSAQTDLASATLKSSIVGTVGSASLVNGASSQGKNIVIVGAGSVEVTVNVPLASMPEVHVGQKADVTPQGATRRLPGAVTSISLLPSTSATGATQATGTGTAQTTASSPVYPVVVLVRDPLPALASGSRAQVSLLIGMAGDVLTLPNSALTPLGNGQALALTFKDGVATRALVKTGYAGTLTTQITSGLAKGQLVVLADLSTALPTNTTNARRFGVGGGAAGGLGGAGIGGAGIGGAGTGGAGGGTITGRTGLTPRG
jgi:multidrug efflux pump subunit AcrA (membrane-fusion protein)